MLPPGHIAAGYLVTRVLLATTHPALTPTDQNYLIWWGMFFSFAPDLDTFIVFKKMGRFISSDKVNHRKFYSHAPVLWLIAGLSIFLIALSRHNLVLEYFGLLVWFGSWAHFALDTIQCGIMWLWPLSNKVLALWDTEIESNIKEQKFVPYLIDFIKFYVTRMTLSFSI